MCLEYINSGKRFKIIWGYIKNQPKAIISKFWVTNLFLMLLSFKTELKFISQPFAVLLEET